MQSLPRLAAESDWLRPIAGQPPSMLNMPPGAFHPRCFSQGRAPAAPTSRPAPDRRGDAPDALPLRRGAARTRRGHDGRRGRGGEWRERDVVEEIHERRAEGDEILRIEGLVKHFPIRGGLLKRQIGQVHAVDGVDLTYAPARRSASSASRAAARRRSAGRSSS